jgi:hypothetical protein
MHESQALFHSIHVRVVKYMCTVMSDLRCLTHGGSKSDRTPNDPSACVERLRKAAAPAIATLSGTRGTDKPTLNTLQLVQSSMQLL